MIEINLLPNESRKREKVKGDGSYSFFLISLAALIVAVTSILFFSIGGVSRQRTRSIEKLRSEWEEMRSSKLEFDRLSAGISEFEKSVDSIKKMAEIEVRWSRLLRGLGEAVTPGMWLSRLNLESKGRSFNYRELNEEPTRMVLTGYFLGRSEIATAGVARFISALKETEDFSIYFDEIELMDMRSHALSDHETMLFTIKCEFKG